MKRFILLCFVMCCILCSCGKTTENNIDDFTTPTSTPLPDFMYFDIDGICLNADSGFYVNPVCDNIDIWQSVLPDYCFEDIDGNQVFIGIPVPEDYFTQTLGYYTVSSQDKEVLDAFTSNIVDIDGDYNYTPLYVPRVQLSVETQGALKESELQEYDSEDIIMYALTLSADGHYYGAGLKDLGYGTEYIFFVPNENVCSLREDNMILLIEDTGELLSLEWLLNPNYVPVILENP